MKYWPKLCPALGRIKKRTLMSVGPKSDKKLAKIMPRIGNGHQCP